jgi:hypothetical protein
MEGMGKKSQGELAFFPEANYIKISKLSLFILHLNMVLPGLPKQNLTLGL